MTVAKFQQLPEPEAYYHELRHGELVKAEMLEKEQICPENGCREFRIVDLDRRQVEVSTQGGHTSWYGPGKKIPLLLAPGKVPAVDVIFA